MNYSSLEAEYKELLSSVEIKDSWRARIEAKAKRIYANRKRYQAISKTIPWQFIGVIHSLESDLDFDTHLHNGDSLNARTRRAPAGRPIGGEPPFTWEESAKDALEQKGYDKVTDWSMAHQCYMLERYNGFGYRTRKTGVNSPYLWSGTNHYSMGKYISDGKYSKTAVSQQTGCIPVLLALKELEETKVVDIASDSRKLSILQRIRLFVGTTVVGWFSVDNIPAAQSYFNLVKDFTWNYGLYIAAAGGVSIWVVCKYLEFLHLQDFKNGTWTPSKTVIPAADGEEKAE